MLAEITVHAELQVTLGLLEIAEDRTKATQLFNKAACIAVEALLNDQKLFKEKDRLKWKEHWHTLRAEYEENHEPKAPPPRYFGPPSRGWDK